MHLVGKQKVGSMGQRHLFSFCFCFMNNKDLENSKVKDEYIPIINLLKKELLIGANQTHIVFP